MTNHKLKNRWTDTHTEAFLNLKAEMTAKLVLRGPKWDGTPFIITTDGSQDAFGAVLTQKFEYALPSGKIIQCQHPLGVRVSKYPGIKLNSKVVIFDNHLTLIYFTCGKTI